MGWLGWFLVLVSSRQNGEWYQWWIREAALAALALTALSFFRVSSLLQADFLLGSWLAV
jgi:hypothetical protein